MNKKLKFALSTVLTIGILLLLVMYLRNIDIPVMNPSGMIALKEQKLIIIATLLMLIVVIPVFILTIFFIWKYREGNKNAKYSPDWDNSILAEAIWWGLPFVIIIILSIITWKSSYELDPYKPLNSNTKPIRIQVIALQWKWLFIYPEHNIASVNFLQFPEQTPINFEITADAPMNSFWIPQLSGQIFAMPRMRTELHIVANEIGSFRGSSANISGRGFSGMTFIAKASSQADFVHWLESVKQSTNSLDLAEYKKLAAPSEYHPVTSYVLKADNLFDRLLMQMPMSMP